MLSPSTGHYAKGNEKSHLLRKINPLDFHVAFEAGFPPFHLLCSVLSPQQDHHYCLLSTALRLRPLWQGYRHPAQDWFQRGTDTSVPFKDRSLSPLPVNYLGLPCTVNDTQLTGILRYRAEKNWLQHTATCELLLHDHAEFRLKITSFL